MAQLIPGPGFRRRPQASRSGGRRPPRCSSRGSLLQHHHD